MKAFRVTWTRIPDQVGIRITTSAGKAKAATMRVLEELGWSAKWSELRCTRAPEYDEWAARQPERRQMIGMLEEYVKLELSPASPTRGENPQ